MDAFQLDYGTFWQIVVKITKIEVLLASLSALFSLASKEFKLLPAIDYWLAFTEDWLQTVILSDKKWSVLQKITKQADRHMLGF